MTWRRLALIACGAVVVYAALFTGISRLVGDRIVSLTQARGVRSAAWLTGCWRMDAANRTVEEHWMAPRGGAMLGMNRTVRDGRMSDHELLVIRRHGDGLAYEAHPAGQTPVVFPARRVEDGRLVFENVDHDFPQEIGYERNGSDGVNAWIAGPQDGERLQIDFTFRRVTCPTAATPTPETSGTPAAR